MGAVAVGPGVVAGLVAVLASIVAWVLDRRRRAFADRPTTPAAAVFAGRNEVKGRAWAPEPLASHRTSTPSVWWHYLLKEERTHTRTVTDTDAKGKTSTRTETYKQWHEIDRRSKSLPTFDVVDGTGSVPVLVKDADVVPRVVHHETFRRDDSRGFLETLFDNRTGRYMETEGVVAVGDALLVVGDAHLDGATSVPVLAERVFLSTRSEESHTTALGAAVAALVVLGTVATTVASALLVEPDDPYRPKAWLPGLGAAAVVLMAAWTLTTYNRLRLVAQGAEFAGSLIDVQLQRRHDLIPLLAAVVASHAGHERSVATAVASGRSDAGEQTRQLRDVFTIAQQHPQLGTDQSFLHLQHQLADAETRIAASQAFYQDSAQLLRDRSRSFPGLLVARRLALKDPELVAAPGFERTVPAVEHTFS